MGLDKQIPCSLLPKMPSELRSRFPSEVAPLSFPAPDPVPAPKPKQLYKSIQKDVGGDFPLNPSGLGVMCGGGGAALIVFLFSIYFNVKNYRSR